MAVTPGKRSNMQLYTDRESLDSLCIKMIVAEKSAPADIIEVNPQQLQKDFLQLSPKGFYPVLVDRDLVLHEPSIIAEYLDERFPHPPLLPVYPVARAKTRLMRLKIEREWFSQLKLIQLEQNASKQKQSLQSLLESILSFSPVFGSVPYFLSEEFSLLDCYVGPLLWHLQKLGIKIPAEVEPIHQYMNRLFNRHCFKVSLNHEEYEPV